jgi:hypothetical protein
LEEIAACREDFVGSEWSFVLLLQASSNVDQETAPIMELMTETLDGTTFELLPCRFGRYPLLDR